MLSMYPAYQIDGDDIPKPSKLSDIDPQAIARELDPEGSTCEAFVNMVSVDVHLGGRSFSRYYWQ